MHTNLSFPNLNSNDVVIERYSTESSPKKITNQEALTCLQDYSSDLGLDYENVINTAPIFNIANLTLGFLGAVHSKSYSSFTGSNKLSEILSQFATQEASTFICEGELLGAELPEVSIKLEK